MSSPRPDTRLLTAAQGLAARWVVRERPVWAHAVALTTAEIEQLFVWARARMARSKLDHTIHQDRDGLAAEVAADLLLDDGWDLCAAAGWPS